MRIAYADLDLNIDIDDDQTIALYFENKKIFRNFVGELKNQIEGEEGHWILSDGGSLIDFNKDTVIIASVLWPDFNNKLIATQLQNILTQIGQDYIDDAAEVNAALQNFWFLLERNYSVLLEHTDYVGVKDLVKLAKFKISADESSVYPLNDYLRVIQEIVGPKIVFLVNAESILEEEELENLLQTARLYDIKLIRLESQFAKVTTFDRTLEKRYIIDKDYCVS